MLSVDFAEQKNLNDAHSRAVVNRTFLVEKADWASFYHFICFLLYRAIKVTGRHEDVSGTAP